MRVLCKVSYDGSMYYGFQKQNNKVTIQGTIEEAIKKITKEDIAIHASGRTDAKVHAYGQMFHFDSSLNMNESNWLHALNSLLPHDIRINKVFFVEDDFHARFNVKRKNYIYKMNLGDYNLFERKYITQFNKDLNLESLNEATELFLGTHDFRNFCSNNEENMDYIRTIYSIDISKKNRYLEFSFVGTGFKKYMIRMIVGTIIAYSTNKIDLDYISNRFDIVEFNTTQFNAKPEGLYLNKVIYERDDIDED